MLVLIICELVTASGAGPDDPERLLHLVWRHATVTDGLEHLRTRYDGGRLHLAAYLLCDPPGDAPDALRRLVRRALDLEPELHDWHLVDTGTDRHQGARHP